MLKDGLKILWDLKNLMGMASRWAKFSEILSHSVRYGMYGFVKLQLIPNCHIMAPDIFFISMSIMWWSPHIHPPWSPDAPPGHLTLTSLVTPVAPHHWLPPWGTSPKWLLLLVLLGLGYGGYCTDILGRGSSLGGRAFPHYFLNLWLACKTQTEWQLKITVLYEPLHEKTCLCHMKQQRCTSYSRNFKTLASLIS